MTSDIILVNSSDMVMPDPCEEHGSLHPSFFEDNAIVFSAFGGIIFCRPPAVSVNKKHIKANANICLKKSTLVSNQGTKSSQTSSRFP